MEGRYQWVEWLEGTECNLSMILQRCPEAFVGKCLVITSFDSGPLMPSEIELARGWEQHGELVVIPNLEATSGLPNDQYDEWYVFPTRTVPVISETFVNDGVFTLVTEKAYIDEATAVLGDQTDMVGAKYRSQRIVERQLHFWHQLRLLNPESFVSNGYKLTFVSSDSHLFQKILTIGPSDQI